MAVKPCCTMLCRCWPMPEIGPSSSVAAALRAITSNRPSWTVTGTVPSRPFSSRSSPGRTSPARPARQQRCHLQHRTDVRDMDELRASGQPSVASLDGVLVLQGFRNTAPS